jgi:hypothetical protein
MPYPLLLELDEPINDRKEFQAVEANIFPMMKDDA